MTALLWGFCERCELWRLSDEWFMSSACASCPVCGGEPQPIERLEDGVARLELVLDLPPGSELPLLA